MPRKPKKQQDDEYVELPEDRLDQIDQAEPVGEEKKETKKARSKPPKQEQAESPKVAKPEKSDPLDSMRDDLLDDIRKELASEEQAEEAEPGFFKKIRGRFGKSSGPETVETETQPETEAEVSEQTEFPEEVVEAKPKKKVRAGSKEEEKAIEEFFSDLEAMADLDFDAELVETEDALAIETDLLAADIEPEFELEPEPETESDEIEALPSELPEEPEKAVEVDLDEVRQIALEEYDGAAVEPEIEVPLQEQVRSTVRELRPLERVLLIVFGALTVGLLLFAGGYLIWNSGVIATPVPTPTEDLTNIIYPIRLELPGGWSFDLSRGRVVDGNWNPRGPEWLEGTEISRWIALPGSVQLEAVLRTLQRDDEITLTMSNFETLVYKVYSLQELTMEQLQAQNSNTPELLVILFSTEGDSDMHWIVTARP